MTPQQAESDERDNKRAFLWIVIAVIVVFLGALAYNYGAGKRGQGPADQGTSQTAPQSQPPTPPAK
jgi:hypothetical protein